MLVQSECLCAIAKLNILHFQDFLVAELTHDENLRAIAERIGIIAAQFLSTPMQACPVPIVWNKTEEVP